MASMDNKCKYAKEEEAEESTTMLKKQRTSGDGDSSSSTDDLSSLDEEIIQRAYSDDGDTTDLENYFITNDGDTSDDNGSDRNDGSDGTTINSPTRPSIILVLVLNR
jgi:hypothetical protein